MLIGRYWLAFPIYRWKILAIVTRGTCEISETIQCRSVKKRVRRRWKKGEKGEEGLLVVGKVVGENDRGGYRRGKVFLRKLYVVVIFVVVTVIVLFFSRKLPCYCPNVYMYVCMYTCTCNFYKTIVKIHLHETTQAEKLEMDRLACVYIPVGRLLYLVSTNELDFTSVDTFSNVSYPFPSETRSRSARFLFLKSLK